MEGKSRLRVTHGCDLIVAAWNDASGWLAASQLIASPRGRRAAAEA
jgi:hypothetical protein